MKKFYLFILIVMLGGCFTGGIISNQNIASIYRNDEQYFHPDFVVYHFADDSSRMYVLLKADELLYVRQSGGIFGSSVKISYRLLQSFESPTLLDSGSKIISTPRPQFSGTEIIDSIHFRCGEQTSGLLECTIEDQNKNTDQKFLISIDKTSRQTAQSFLILENGKPFFNNYLTPGDSVIIFHRDASVKNVTVHYFHRQFPLAPPPFSFDVNTNFDYVSDSTFNLPINNFSPVVFSSEGFYHLRMDTTQQPGLTLFRFHSDFPQLTTPQQLIEPLRYLVSKKEFEELKKNPNPHNAVDEFWLNLGGNSERAKKLIRKYYQRVQKANEIFTSYTEGWRTDRGLIYIIFGSPNLVYKGSTAENWVYGESNSAQSLSFSFLKVENPFSENDYSLERAPIYESSWYRAIDTWRQGRVYNDYYDN